VSEFVVDFLPHDLHRKGRLAVSRRRSTLLLALLAAMVVGTAAHSWNRFREAQSRRAVSLALTTNGSKVDDVVDRLASEQGELRRFLGTYDRLALPVEHSDLVATITHLMPDRTSLGALRLEVREQAPAKAEKDQKQPKAGARGGAAAGTPAASPARWVDVTVRGYAAGNGELYEFERRLAGTEPFEGVTVSENKAVDVPGARIQEFTVTCRIPLAARYVRPGRAQGPGGSAQASAAGGAP
jgi:hypothetical protein